MKQIISRLKNISMMLIWDVITAVALFVLTYFVMDELDTTFSKFMFGSGSIPFCACVAGD